MPRLEKAASLSRVFRTDILRVPCSAIYSAMLCKGRLQSSAERLNEACGQDKAGGSIPMERTERPAARRCPRVAVVPTLYSRDEWARSAAELVEMVRKTGGDGAARPFELVGLRAVHLQTQCILHRAVICVSQSSDDKGRPREKTMGGFCYQVRGATNLASAATTGATAKHQVPNTLKRRAAAAAPTVKLPIASDICLMRS
jgi:hypothetical protein